MLSTPCRNHAIVNFCISFLLFSTKQWAEGNKMEAFLSVSKGSDQLPVFLEIKYKGDESGSDPLVLVGKGVTFDR